MNSFTVTGRLAADPDLRFAKSGTAMCNLTIPDQKRRKNDAGEWEDASDTTWVRVTVFGDAATWISENASKGTPVVATGRLITREFEGRDGQQRSSLEIDYATVGIAGPKPRATVQQPTSDAWSNGGGGNAYDDNPF